MFDDLKRGEDDNPTIGIILCADKDETIVKYSILKESRQLFASKYKTVLPTEEELAVELEQNARNLRERPTGQRHPDLVRPRQPAAPLHSNKRRGAQSGESG